MTTPREGSVELIVSDPTTLRETEEYLRTFPAGRVFLAKLDCAEAVAAERDQAQARFSTLWAFLEWVRTRDWTLAQLDERATKLHDEGPAEIGINVVAERDALAARVKRLEVALQRLGKAGDALLSDYNDLHDNPTKTELFSDQMASALDEAASVLKP